MTTLEAVVLGTLLLVLLLLALEVWTLVYLRRRTPYLASPRRDSWQTGASPLEEANPEAQVVRAYCERWDRLTLRKRQIARLAAAGKQNGEIADELQVSPETIGTHLRDTYKTLGIHSRRELANVIRDVEK